MDPILATIDAALKKKGLSDAAASTLAVGHPSLLKNLRMPRQGEKRYNLPSLMKLAEVLDLELYFGPKRTIPGFSEGESATDLGRAEALRGGYVPLPWHTQAGQKGSSPVAFSRAWLDHHGIKPDNLRAVRITDSKTVGFECVDSIAVIDTAAPRGTTPRYWVAISNGTPRLTLAEFHGKATILPGLGADGSAEVIIPPEPAPVLGQVVWIGVLAAT